MLSLILLKGYKQETEDRVVSRTVPGVQAEFRVSRENLQGTWPRLFSRNNFKQRGIEEGYDLKKK